MAPVLASVKSSPPLQGLPQWIRMAVETQRHAHYMEPQELASMIGRWSTHMQVCDAMCPPGSVSPAPPGGSPHRCVGEKRVMLLLREREREPPNEPR